MLAVVIVVSACAAPSPRREAAAREQVAAATRAWIDTLNSHDLERILALYDSDALLWGTTSPTIRDNPAKIRDYFKFLSTAPTHYKAVLGEQHIRVYGEMAVNTGTYTFMGPALDTAGQPVGRPARFTFVYRQAKGRWLIVDHHSSALPAAPSTAK